jgi:hypothetical protein
MSTRLGPKRSTAKPAAAWPTPEMMKKMVINAPTSVKLRPKSRISHGNNGGSSRWKKCDVPWAKPTTPMRRASWRAAAVLNKGGMTDPCKS